MGHYFSQIALTFRLFSEIKITGADFGAGYPRLMQTWVILSKHYPQPVVEELRQRDLLEDDPEKGLRLRVELMRKWLRQVRGDWATALAEGLQDARPAAAYATAQLIQALGRSQHLQTEERATLYSAVAATLRSAAAQQPVYVLDTNNEIAYRGLLEQALGAALQALSSGRREIAAAEPPQTA
ncbi:MAG: hypothetical protein OHK0052_04150 [Anaerolineales bacterium]